MNPQIYSAFLGFLLGIAVTVIVQRLILIRRYHDPRRAKKLADLVTLKTWMESYRALFDAMYPECPELILAHKMLSPVYPHYDKAAPLKLYDALREYRTLQLKHEELTRQAEISLQELADKRLDRLNELSKKVTSAFQKTGLLKNTRFFPVSFSTDIQDHLTVIDQYRQKVFEEFPAKVVSEIEWEKLDHVPPDQLCAIVHPLLHYFQEGEELSRDREKESKLFDEMQNLSFYRIVAKKEIDRILSKIKHREEWYSLS